MLLYVNTYTALCAAGSYLCHHPIWGKEIGCLRTPFLFVICYQIVDVPTFIRLALQPFY